MAKQMTVWVADDGTQFNSPEEANEHEKWRGKANAVSKVLTDYGLYGATASGAAAAIIECWHALKDIVEAPSN